MGLLTYIIFLTVIVVGVAVGSPFILGCVGLSATGPVAGSLFATYQGAAISAGSWMAAAQAVAMSPVTP